MLEVRSKIQVCADLSCTIDTSASIWNVFVFFHDFKTCFARCTVLSQSLYIICYSTVSSSTKEMKTKNTIRSIGKGNTKWYTTLKIK